MSRYRRWRQRQQDLARGVDADLVRTNNRRFGLAVGLVALGFLLFSLSDRPSAGETLRSIVIVAGGVCLFGGYVMGQWALWERRFLKKADPEPPPSILDPKK